MVDVRRPYHPERAMSRGGPMRSHEPSMTERAWMNGPAGYPSMTKEYSGAAVPSLRDNTNNSGSARAQFPHFVDRDTIYSTAAYTSHDNARGSSARPMSLPQRPTAEHDTRGRPPEGLPQRPEPHIQPPNAAKMSQPEVCRNFLAGRCLWGDKCHRSHSAGGVPNGIPVASTNAHSDGPDARQSQPQQFQISTTVRVVGGIYTDRLRQNHRIDGDQPAQIPVVRAAGPPAPLAAHTHTAHHTPPTRQQSQIPQLQPPLVPSPPPPDENQGPENLDALRLSRVAELDPRPSRRYGEVCQLFQKGKCLYGDKCHMTHIFLLPQSCITQLLPPAPKPLAKKVPATVRYTAPDGSIREREVCKMDKVGLCVKGDSCRYAHIADCGLESDSTDTESETSDADAFPESNSVQSTSQGTTMDASDQKGLRTSREVCRRHFEGRRCYKLPCKLSHNVLDLTQLPLEHKLVRKHADQIREALMANQSAPLASTSSSASLEPDAVPDTAKKRQKKPRKPGTEPPTVPPESVNGQASAMSKGKGRADSKLPGMSSGSSSIHSTVTQTSQAPRDADGDSSDATFYSVVLIHRPGWVYSYAQTLQRSQASITQASQTAPAASRPNEAAQKVCFDYLHGRCRRQVCRYIHDPDNEQMRLQLRESGGTSKAGVGSLKASLQAPPATRTSSSAHIPPATTHNSNLPPTMPSRGGSMGRPTVGNQLPPSSLEQSAPMVPPGLGLEAQLASGGLAVLQPQAPPETMTITVLDSTKVTFGPGFTVSQIITGFECRQVLVEDLPASAVPASVSEALARFGTVTAIVPNGSDADSKSTSYKVTFASGDAASQAVAALNGKRLFGREVSVRLVQKMSTVLGGGTLLDGDVLFELPAPWQIGFVGYPTEELANRAIALAPHAKTGLSQVVAEKHLGIPNVGSYNVRFHNIPPNFTIDDLKKHFVRPLVEQDTKQGEKKKRRGRGKGKDKEKEPDEGEKEPKADPVAEICEGAMLQRAKYTSLQGAFHGLQRMLEQYDEDVTINALPPPYRKFVRVWAHFSSPTAASAACEALHRYCPRFVGKGRIFAHHVKTLRYQLPPSVFDVLAPEINLLRSYLHDDDNTTISVMDRRSSLGPDAAVVVKLVSQSMASLTKAKTTFDRLLRGEKVTDGGQIVWNDFFAGSAGEEFLRELEQENPRVKITSDSRRRTLSLFGVHGDRERVRDLIVHKVRLLKSQLVHRYPLPGHLIVGFLSDDLVKLRQHLGSENAWVDLTNQQLIIHGDEETQKIAQLAVLHAQQRRARPTRRGDDSCPVCFGEASPPVTLACGHTWCKGCLVGYFKASVDSKSFPLTCLADAARCAHPISLLTAQRLLSTEEFDALVYAAFLAHVQQRPKEFHYCPTPDCPQVYRKSTAATRAGAGGAGAVLQCPSCLVRICAHCNMEAHEAASCQDRNPEAEGLFETWKAGHDVKDCPGCKVPIERAAGCNHMTCASCKIHICWVCLATFPVSGAVYDHMRSIHGGIGL